MNLQEHSILLRILTSEKGEQIHSAECQVKLLEYAMFPYFRAVYEFAVQKGIF